MDIESESKTKRKNTYGVYTDENVLKILGEQSITHELLNGNTLFLQIIRFCTYKFLKVDLKCVTHSHVWVGTPFQRAHNSIKSLIKFHYSHNLQLYIIDIFGMLMFLYLHN